MFSYCRLYGMRLWRLVAVLAALSVLAPFASAVISLVPDKGCEMECCRRSAAKDSCHRAKHSHHDNGPKFSAEVSCGDCGAVPPGMAAVDVIFPSVCAQATQQAYSEPERVAARRTKYFSPIAHCLFQRPPPAL